MLAGRAAVMRGAAEDKDGNLPPIWQWADQGQTYLNEKFKNTNLQFMTVADGKHIVLTVYRLKDRTGVTEILKIREQAEYFVSELTVTKLIMVM